MFSRTYFVSGKIYKAKNEGSGHDCLGYFHLMFDAKIFAKEQTLMSEAEEHIAKKFKIEEKCIHIETMIKM